MKLRSTLILFVAALGLFGYIRFYDSRQLGTRAAADRDQHVLMLDRDQVNGITIMNTEGTIELRKKDNRWHLTAPVNDSADALAIDQLFTAAETLKKEGAVDEESRSAQKDLAKEFGVAKSNVRLKFHGPGAPPEILFGKETAVEGKVYARLEDAKAIYAINKDLKTLVQKKADEFRDRRLAQVNVAAIEMVNITTPAGVIEVQKEGEMWQLNKPLKARGDATTIRDLLAQILNTRIEQFIADDDPAIATSGLDEPRAMVQFSEGGGNMPLTLQIGLASAREQEKVFARVSSRNGIYLLPKTVADVIFLLKPNDLRDRHLLRLDLDIVDRINITAGNGEKVVLARKEESWAIQNVPNRPSADAGQVRQLAEGLLNQTVIAFAADVASDLGKYGLDRPEVRVTFASYASENTAESKAGENVVAELLFGKVNGNIVYARLEEEPFIVSVPRTILELVPANPDRWFDLGIFKLSPAQITSLEVTKEGHGPVSLTRDEKGTWRAVGRAETEPLPGNIASLCNALASLRAVRWSVAAPDPETFAKPAVVVNFRTRNDVTHKLVVGEPTSEGLWHARAEGIRLPFLMSNPDVGALQLALIKPAGNEVPSAGAAR